MNQTSIDDLKTVIRTNWDIPPSEKARRYIGKFFDRNLIGKKIVAKVEGNHGTYIVSIEVKQKDADSACSCYIGREGYCHHCEALALTFLRDPNSFERVKHKTLKRIHSLDNLKSYLKGKTLDALLKELKSMGITQKAFAESIGMNPGHLTAIKSSELRNRYFNELGATKLACLWVIEHINK